MAALLVALRVRPTVPLPFWITPLKVVEPLVGASVNTGDVELMLSVIVPPLPLESDSEVTCWLWPSRSKLALEATVSAVAEERVPPGPVPTAPTVIDGRVLLWIRA